MSKESKYSQEFRETAVQLALKGEKSIAQVAKELGIDKHLLYSWIKSAKGKRVATGTKVHSQTSAEEELKELRKRNKQLEQENEILKKAAAYFAKTLL